MWMGTFGLTFIYKRSPWIPAWWSASLPGLGHMQIGMHLRGTVLMSSEIIMNFCGHLNEVILYTITL